MLLKDVSFESPEENVLFDDVLLHMAEQGQAGEVLRFWESPTIFVVLGRISKQEDDVNAQAVRKDAIKVLRRSSGGGTVLQGPGCLNYSLVLSKAKHPDIKDLHRSYEYILSRVVKAFKNLGIETAYFPISDLALVDNQKKISGNSQRRSRQYILHHGTILYDFDLSLVNRYLKIPKDMPEYRKKRSHLDFVDNVSVLAENIKQALKDVYNVEKQERYISEEEKKYLMKFVEAQKIKV